MDNILLMEIVDCLENLSDRLGSIFLCEFSLLANAVEQLSTCS